MKLLVLAPQMEVIGGIQRYIATFVRALRGLLTEGDVRLLAVPTHPEAGSKGPQRLALPVKLHFAGKALREAARWQPHVVISAHVGLAPLAWLLRLVLRRPYWVIAYGTDVWGKLSFWKRHALARTDRLLAISDFTREQVVRRCGLAAERTFLLPPAFEKRASSGVAPRDAVPVRDGRRIVLTVGRLAASERYKGHDVILRAWPSVRQRVPEAVYLIVGDGDDRPRLEAIRRELELGDSVCFAGAVGEDVLAACYEACEVFAMPARTVLDARSPQGEGFGIVFLEAMACGKPVLGPNYGAATEFIHHGEHGLLVDPQDPARVAQSLIDLLTSPERARQMGRTAREWVLREYGYDRFCERIQQILNQPGQSLGRGNKSTCAS